MPQISRNSPARKIDAAQADLYFVALLPEGKHPHFTARVFVEASGGEKSENFAAQAAEQGRRTEREQAERGEVGRGFGDGEGVVVPV